MTEVSNDVLASQIAALDRHVMAEIVALRRETLMASETAEKAVAVANVEAKERLDQHNNVIGQMRELSATFATRDALERVEAWQGRLTGGILVIAFIGIVNLAKLWFT